MEGPPRLSAVCQRGDHAQPGLMTLQIPLTRAAGNEDVHFYLMEIPEDLQMGTNILPRRGMGSSHWGTPQGPRETISEVAVLPAPQPLTFFRILMATVSTKLMGLKSKMTA